VNTTREGRPELAREPLVGAPPVTDDDQGTKTEWCEECEERLVSAKELRRGVCDPCWFYRPEDDDDYWW